MSTCSAPQTLNKVGTHHKVPWEGFTFPCWNPGGGPSAKQEKPRGMERWATKWTNLGEDGASKPRRPEQNRRDPHPLLQKCPEKLGRIWNHLTPFKKSFPLTCLFLDFEIFKPTENLKEQSVERLCILHMIHQLLTLAAFTFSFPLWSRESKSQPLQLFISKYISTCLWARTFSCITVMIQLSHPRTLTPTQ